MKGCFSLFIIIVIFSICSGILFSQGIEVEGDVCYYSNRQSFDLSAPKGADFYFWNVPEGVKCQKQFNRLIVIECPKGKHTFTATTYTVVVDFDNKTKKTIENRYELNIVVNSIKPEPEPKPEPDPDPKPEPQPAPINADGLHVLIVYESKEKHNLPKEQFNIIYTLPFREYLDKVCAEDPNASAAYRIWDQQEDTEYAAQKWQDVMKRNRNSVPWLVVSNPSKGGFEGPLPNSIEETKAIIEKLK